MKPHSPRQRTEALLLEPFKWLANELGLPYKSGQGGANRISISKSAYFQFGDLHVDLPDRIVVVEVESAGGVTNLAKYWEALASGRIAKPLKLLHVFLQKSANDYEAHLLVWRFLQEQMSVRLGRRWEALCATTTGTSHEELQIAVEQFHYLLTHNAV